MRCEWAGRTPESVHAGPRTGWDGLSEKQALPRCLMQWRPLHYKSLLKSHAAFHVYREHMEKPAIFRPQNKPLCSWTNDRTGSFLPREPHPRGVGPLTVIKPPQFSQQNRSYIKLKYRGLINKAWAGEKRMEWRKATIIFRLFSPHGHGQCKAMRYISKHEADVYLDKGGKKKTKHRAVERASTPTASSNVTFALESIPVLAQCRGMVLHLFEFSLFLIENAGESSLATNTVYRGKKKKKK